MQQQNNIEQPQLLSGDDRSSQPPSSNNSMLNNNHHHQHSVTTSSILSLSDKVLLGQQQQQEEEAAGSKWSKLSLNSNNADKKNGDDINNDNDSNNNNNVLLVSNPRVPLSHATAGIRHAGNFMNACERFEILQTIQEQIQHEFVWEGFDHRRRVKRYQLHVLSPSNNSSSSCSNSSCSHSLLEQSSLSLNVTTNSNDNNDAESPPPPPPPPSILVTWAKRLYDATGLVPTHVSVEEYAAPKWSHSGAFASHHTVTNFESSSLSSSSASSAACPNHSSYYFVAQVPLNKAAIQHLNRPRQRLANCWELESNGHCTNVYMEPGSLLVKTDECLWDWRYRIMADASTTTVNASSSCDNNTEKDGDTSNDNGNDSDKKKKVAPTVPPVLILKFYNLPSHKQTSSSCKGETTSIDDNENEEEEDEKDQFGYVASSRIARLAQQEANAAIQVNVPMPPLSELLTIIITTSPVRSNPSTELLQRTMQTFCHAGNPDFCYNCRKVIVCDGFRTKQESEPEPGRPDQQQQQQQSDTAKQPGTTKFYSNDKQAMRNGIVTQDQAENYRQFKLALQKLCTEAEQNNESSLSPSVFSNTTIVELEERHGYGFALRHALRHCVSTRFVCVIQHDRTFMRPTPVQQVVHTMWRRPHIKYVGFSMRSNLMYRDIFNGKYGKTYGDQLSQMILRPPELLLDASVYGPDSQPIDKMSALLHSDKVRQKVESLAENYHSGSSQAMGQREWLLQQEQQQQESHNSNNTTNIDSENGETTNSYYQLSLTPTLFWYDNIHVCDTAHYRDFIFHPSYKMVARGGFVEDKLSPVLKRTVERLGLQEGHARFGCYLLDDHSGTFFTGHLDGGSFLTEAGKEATYLRHCASNGSFS